MLIKEMIDRIAEKDKKFLEKCLEQFFVIFRPSDTIYILYRLAAKIFQIVLV